MGHVSDAPEQFAELKRQVLDRVDLSREVSDEEMLDLIYDSLTFDFSGACSNIIMNNGGVFENKILYPPEDKMIERYWITL